MASLVRRQQSAAAGEERRRVLLEVQNDDDMPEAAELVEVSGRHPEHKNGERLRGAYMRTESDKAPIVYQKLQFDTGVFREHGPFLILEIGKAPAPCFLAGGSLAASAPTGGFEFQQSM